MLSAAQGLTTEKKRKLAECRGIISSVDSAIEELGMQLRTVFTQWRSAVDERERETLEHLESMRNEYVVQPLCYCPHALGRWGKGLRARPRGGDVCLLL